MEQSSLVITPLLLIHTDMKNANNPPEIRLLKKVKDEPFRSPLDVLSLSSLSSSSESLWFLSDIVKTW